MHANDNILFFSFSWTSSKCLKYEKNDICHCIDCSLARFVLAWFVVQVGFTVSPAVLRPNRTCLRCVLPKCLMSQRSPSLFPPHHRPSTLPPPIDKPRLLLLSRTTIAPVPLNRSPLEETQNKKGNSDWLSYRNRLEDGKWRGREAYETRQVGGPRRTALPNVGECWNTEKQMCRLLSFRLLRPQLSLCLCPLA